MHRNTLSRRSFLDKVAAGAAAGSMGCLSQAVAQAAASATPAVGGLTTLGEHLLVYHGPIQVGIVRDGTKALLIDCGDGSVAGALPKLGITSVEQLIFTHHHRDQACGAYALADKARVGVPADERDSFDKVVDYWRNPKSRWHLYNIHPHHLSLAEPLRVDEVYRDGQELAWGPAKIRVIGTPGHTDGSVSYLVEVDGRRIVFCGDAIYDEGRIWDLSSLQKGTQTTDYHGFLGARPQLARSLDRIKAAKPDVLVPSHGHIMTKPSQAVDALVKRLDGCYDKYVAISALRHYFPKMFVEYANRADHMAMRPGKAVPDCLEHIGTTWLLISKDKSALVMDCGGAWVVEKLKKLVEDKKIGKIEGLWVTHYHDDHVDGIPEFQKAFDCPCITDSHVAEVIRQPLAWRLPCVSPHRARVDRATRDGDSWTWHEFKLTAYHLPGQTLYHSGLLVEGQGLRMLFTGDSFTMGGIDDYCAQNRNWLGRDLGFDHCVALIERLRPTHLFNCHVKDAFDFTPEQCTFMRANLAQRERLYGDLFPWDDANYGMDESWVRCFPYEQQVEAGRPANLEVRFTNHSPGAQKAACRVVLPRAWGNAAASHNTATAARGDQWPQVEVAAKSDGQVSLSFQVPAGTLPGRYVIPVDVHYGPWTLPQFTEAIVVVGAG